MRTIFEIHLAGESDARETAEMSRDLIEKGLVWTQWPKRLLAMVTHPEYAVIAAQVQSEDRRICCGTVTPAYQRH